MTKTCEKFIRRFDQVEQGAAKRGAKIADLTLAELLDLWKQAKHGAADL